MIARGIPDKGWEIAILAFLLLNRKNIQLILIGESQYLQYLREKYPCPTIIFQGFSSDPLKAVQQFDVGLFPSYYASESLPTTIIEYLLSGKPVITSDVGECATMITHNGDLGGIILPIEKGIPEVNDLVSAMKRFLDDHLYYIHCSTIARSASKKFEMKFCMNEYIKMYKNLVEENQTDLA
jgi:glycosyltransferase involved in cell wall biosynthesis